MYDLYKPFRNRLRSLSVLAALEVVNAYIQFLQFGMPLPTPLRNPQMDYKKPQALGMLEWEMELLAREILTNSPVQGNRSIATWGDFASLMNTIKQLENEAYRARIDSGDILFELTRIAHRQWPWQTKLNQSDLARHFRLYNHPRVLPLIEAVFGMTPTELYQIGLSLAMCFQHGMVTALPIPNHINQVDQAIVDRFIDHFSGSLSELGQEARNGQSFDINWAYNFNPLRRRPLVRTPDGRLALPLMPFLLRRLMDGLYFDIVGVPGFGPAFGASFQDYVGDVLRAANRHASLTIKAEQPYGPKKKREDSVDWLVLDSSGVLFLECKVARMRIAGKIDLASRDALKGEITKLAGYVIQMYATLQDALDGHYPHWSPDARPIFPMVITFDEWNAFGHHIHDMLEAPIVAGLAGRGIDAALVERFPFQICSISEFETISQMMANHSIAHIMSRKLERDHRMWPFQSFLTSYLGEEWKECDQLFPDIWVTLQQDTLDP